MSNKSVETNSISEILPSKVLNGLSNVTEDDAEFPGISEIKQLSGSSNDVLHLDMNDGRSLMVKRAPYDWAGPRFKTARLATSLLRKKSSLIVPEHVRLPEDISDMPMLAYWFISLPTVENLWPHLSSSQRIGALHSLGGMLKKMHQVEVDKFGPLHDDQNLNSVSAYMEHDLRVRLRSAVWSAWPQALPIIDRLGHMASYLPETSEKATLIHNDLHLDNVLCKFENGEVKCVGLLDFEAAKGGRPESDLASSIVLHHPLFAADTETKVKDFSHHLLKGYNGDINYFVLNFFKVYHLLNLGYFSALNNNNEHANQVAEVARKQLKAI